MFFKILIVALLLVIVISLGTAMFSMLKNDADSTRTVKALTIRIALSLALIIMIMVGYTQGLITPNGSPFYTKQIDSK